MTRDGAPTRVHGHWMTRDGAPTRVHGHWMTRDGAPTRVHGHWMTRDGAPTRVHGHCAGSLYKSLARNIAWCASPTASNSVVLSLNLEYQ